jgi:5-methylcytosine-specific restriction protein A
MAVEDQLAITALTSRARVLEAIADFDRLGREEFLSRYGYGPSRRYRLRHKGKVYDSKAIAGVAWGLQHFNDPDRRPDSYTGGAHTSVPTLERLGFTIEVGKNDVGGERGDEDPPRLTAGRPYSWEELGGAFDFPPDYLGRVGGMVSRPRQRSLLLITHGQDGRAFSYGDEWDDPDLIYAGRGLTGDQELKGANRLVAENARQLFLFESAGSRQLHFHGLVRCVDCWESTGFDKRGEERRVYRFRLAPLNSGKTTRRKIAPPKAPRTGQARRADSFRPRPFDPDRQPSERRRSTLPDPESQKVLAEQADRTHQATLKAVGLWLQTQGWSELEEIDGAIDLLGKRPSRSGGKALFEIKSIVAGSERQRVRSGLAQLLEYRLFLGDKSDKLCLVTNRPISERRLRLLDSLSIGHLYVAGAEVHVSGTKASRRLFPIRRAAT